MANVKELKTHVPEETKQAVQALAIEQGLTEAAWLRRLVESALPAAGPRPSADEGRTASRHGRPMRLTVRVRPDDHQLLEARAQARSMAPATYASFLLRSHLRSLAPLPIQELAAVKRAVAELGAIGRNLNQIARIAHQSGRAAGPGHQELMALLKVCEGLRDHVKGLIRVNLQSWETGYAAPPNG